ncbi:MAG: TolC family protein, partial [Candidatus Binatia bacterium]
MNERRLAFAALIVALAGCAAVAPERDSGFAAVSATVGERTGRDVARLDDSDGGGATTRSIRALIGEGLAADEAVEIALLNNRELQAVYTDLDVAQSDLVQSSLLHNPVADVVAGFPVGGGMVDLSFGVALDVIDLLYVPLRKRVASARFEETKLRVAGQVLDLAWRTQTAFHEHQADEQMLEMRRQVAASTAASSELARRMREAGNSTELELASEQALAEEAKLELRLAEVEARESRERLNSLMGLWGEEAGAWQAAPARLPDPSLESPDVERLESRAVERSLDLAAAERLIVAAGENLGLDRASALFPELVVGGGAERDGPEWEPGPTLTLALPFFDRGQARIARARAELRRARELRPF